MKINKSFILVVGDLLEKRTSRWNEWTIRRMNDWTNELIGLKNGWTKWWMNIKGMIKWMNEKIKGWMDE